MTLNGSDRSGDKKDQLNILMIRHGQTDYNFKKILQGHLDTQLNDQGKKEAELLGDRLKKEYPKIDAVWSSDLTRCKQTTEIFLERYNQKIEPEYLYELRERSMGKLEGHTVVEAKAISAAEQKGFQNYGETRRHATDRLNSAFDKIVEKSIRDDHGIVVIVSHGGVISKFIKHVVDNGFKISNSIKDDDIMVPHNTSITTLSVDKLNKTGLVTGFGDAKHLGDNLREVDQNEK